MAKTDPALLTLTEQIRRDYGQLVTAQDVREMLKCSRATAYAWLADVSYYKAGRKLYGAEDIAGKLLRCKNVRLEG